MINIFINKRLNYENPLKNHIAKNLDKTGIQEKYKIYEIFKVKSNLDISQSSLKTLEGLLQSNLLSHSFKSNEEIISIFHRSNILSPWSSKAAEIIESCNLEKNLSIERGLIYEFRKKSKIFSSLIRKKLSIYDPMTQICFVKQKPVSYTHLRAHET